MSEPARSRPLLPGTGRMVDRAVALAQAGGRVPSLVLAVVREGGLVHVAAAGDGPGAVPADPAVQFRIGSITKTMTAVLVLQERDGGRLGLDDPLHRHLPGTPLPHATPRQLLAHVSGLRREPAGPWWERAPGQRLPDLLAGVGPDPLAHPPQRRHHYSNLAYGLLGAVLRQVTGLEWAQLVEQRLCRPLGLTRTSYLPREPFARGYVVHPWHGTLREQPRHETGAMAPAGQLWSTLADLGRWGDFLAAPDPRVLAPATAEEMCAPVAISDPGTWRAGHGLGPALWRRGDRVYVGHAGSMPGYLAVLVVHRRSRTGVVGFANAYTLAGTTLAELATGLLTTVLEREPPPPPAWKAAAPPPPEVVALAGRWWWMGRGFDLDWAGDGTELVLRHGSGPAGAATRFRPEGPDRWRGSDGPDAGEVLTVRRDPAGQAVALEIATFVYTRQPDDPDPPHPGDRGSDR